MNRSKLRNDAIIASAVLVGAYLTSNALMGTSMNKTFNTIQWAISHPVWTPSVVLAILFFIVVLVAMTAFFFVLYNFLSLSTLALLSGNPGLTQDNAFFIMIAMTLLVGVSCVVILRRYGVYVGLMTPGASESVQAVGVLLGFIMIYATLDMATTVVKEHVKSNLPEGMTMSDYEEGLDFFGSF